MVKISHGNRGCGPVAEKVISALRKASGRKVIDLSRFKEARLDAENLVKTVVSEKEMAKLDPVHAVYVYAQNMMSVLGEQLGELPELSKLVNALADAEEEYMPSYPPMSPLSTSYFTCWSFFDLTTGVKRETLGTIIIDACRSLGVNEGLLTVFELLQNSRMGFYAHEGVSGKRLRLRELVTGKEMEAIYPTGYRGKAGQIWYARVMPEPFPELGCGYAVVFTTPYVILEITGKDRAKNADEKRWLEFFERTLPKVKIKDTVAAYEHFMKYGLSRKIMGYERPGMHYWNEYIFEGYVNYRNDMINLAGFPDIALSRPHSSESQKLRGE